MKVLFVLAFPVLLAACAREPAGMNGGQGGHDLEVGTGQEFTLAVGQTAHVGGTEVLIHFAGVDEDSRCPSDVQCPWQGDGAVRLELSSRIAQFAPQPVVLHTGLDPREVSMLGVAVRLADLAPYPKASGPSIDPQSYTARLVVTR